MQHSILAGGAGHEERDPAACLLSSVPHIRKSMPDSGLGLKVKVLETFLVIPASLGGG